jgi:hypothetical protein
MARCCVTCRLPACAGGGAAARGVQGRAVGAGLCDHQPAERRQHQDGQGACGDCMLDLMMRHVTCAVASTAGATAGDSLHALARRPHAGGAHPARAERGAVAAPRGVQAAPPGAAGRGRCVRAGGLLTIMCCCFQRTSLQPCQRRRQRALAVAWCAGRGGHHHRARGLRHAPRQGRRVRRRSAAGHDVLGTDIQLLDAPA